jgi:hypothetical protein
MTGSSLICGHLRHLRTTLRRRLGLRLEAVLDRPEDENSRPHDDFAPFLIDYIIGPLVGAGRVCYSNV